MPRKQSNIHYIYKTTCLITGKFYIGMHSTSNINDDYLGSGKRLRRSIRKYGKENHIKEILEFLPDSESLKNREKEIVNSDMIKDKMCMNLMEGGKGGFISFDLCSKGGKKGIIALRNRINTEPKLKEKQLISSRLSLVKARKTGAYKTSFLGKHHTDESKKKIGNKNSEHQKGEKNSQFGTCWITNGIENKKIKIFEVNDYIEIGWIKGRNLKQNVSVA